MRREAGVQFDKFFDWRSRAGQGALPAEPLLLRDIGGVDLDLVAPSRGHCGMRLRVFSGEGPLPRPALSRRTSDSGH